MIARDTDPETTSLVKFEKELAEMYRKRMYDCCPRGVPPGTQECLFMENEIP
jgi:hypothetical protein